MVVVVGRFIPLSRLQGVRPFDRFNRIGMFDRLHRLLFLNRFHRVRRLRTLCLVGSVSLVAAVLPIDESGDGGRELNTRSDSVLVIPLTSRRRV